MEELCRQALRAIRFWGGRGYYFALDTKGVVQVNGAQPQLEGADLLGVVDTEGRPVNRDMIDLAQSRGRGYYEYTWAKPGHQGTGFRKVSAIRYCRALDWVIGLGEYWDDWSNAAQREVLRNLEEAVGHKDGRLFAGTFDGQALLGAGNSGSLPDAADVTGREVVGKLVAAARHGGGLRGVRDAGQERRASPAQGVLQPGRAGLELVRGRGGTTWRTWKRASPAARPSLTARSGTS